MQSFNIWKKLAAGLLFFNIVFTGFINQPLSPENASAQEAADTSDTGLTIRHMGIGSGLAVGPGNRFFDGGSLSMLADSGNRQMLSLILQDKNGALVVVDGGWSDDQGHLADVIRSKGGHVSGWFLTHPHSDHAGALISILNNPDSQITIDNIYYNFTSQDWYDTFGNGRGSFVAELREALAKVPQEKLHGDITKGQEFQFGEIRAVVMNNPYLLQSTSVNNSSVVYKFYLNGVSILVLGDLGPEAGDLMLMDNGAEALKSDIVQMSHHGQYGVGRDVYAAVNPSIALWPCPQWLWDNNNGGGVGSGDWKTLETRQWMEELGVRANYSIKDGDQVIY